jgi:hypothetical protein
LVELAKRRDLRKLREECARVQARAEDDAQRAERLYRQRSLRTWTGADGSWNLIAKHTPEAGAQVEAALATLREAVFQSARRAGNHESGEAYGADALVEMARRSAATEDARPAEDQSDVPAGGDDVTNHDAGEQPDTVAGQPPNDPATATDAPTDGVVGDPVKVSDPEGEAAASGRAPARSRRPDTKVIVLVSYDALKRGLAEAGETCEIAGVGPVPVATVRSLMGDAFGAAIVTNGVDVFTVAHLGRSVTAYQRSALEARGYCCEVPGCGSTTALEIDHIEDWALTFRTKLDRLAWHCKPHHHDKTHRGWRLEGPPGDRRWVPPPEAVPRRDSPGPPTGARRAHDTQRRRDWRCQACHRGGILMAWQERE